MKAMFWALKKKVLGYLNAGRTMYERKASGQ